MTEYPDTNGNGVPDAFEKRLPISLVLSEEDRLEDEGTVIVEIEKVERSPRNGEMYICGGKILRATFDYGTHDNPFTTLIVRRIVAGSLVVESR